MPQLLHAEQVAYIFMKQLQREEEIEARHRNYDKKEEGVRNKKTMAECAIMKLFLPVTLFFKS